MTDRADGGQTIHSLQVVQIGEATKKKTHINLLRLGRGKDGVEWHFLRPLEDTMAFPEQWPNRSVHMFILLDRSH